jgi:hypothetical protein
MDPTKVGDTCIESNPKNLSYVNKALFYVLCITITPTNRPEQLQGIIAIALYILSIGIRFDVPDLFITNLAYAAETPQALKPYAPWIMYAIEQITERKFFCPHMSKAFIPPVIDTLQAVKDIGKGKTPVDPSATSSGPAPRVKKVNVEVPRKENPSLYEICLRTQQALESHIKLDQKEKVEMMIELNLLHNYTRQALLHVKELQDRSWILLRKHYSRSQLKHKGIEKDHDYLNMFEVPRIRRQTPVLPQRSASTDLLFVEPGDEIEDTIGSLVYKPLAPRSPSDQADPALSTRFA